MYFCQVVEKKGPVGRSYIVPKDGGSGCGGGGGGFPRVQSGYETDVSPVLLPFSKLAALLLARSLKSRRRS